MNAFRKLSSFSFLLLFFSFTAFTNDLYQDESDELIDPSIFELQNNEPDDDTTVPNIFKFDDEQWLNEKLEKVPNPGQRKHRKTLSEGDMPEEAENSDKKSLSPVIERFRRQHYKRTVTPNKINVTKPNKNSPSRKIRVTKSTRELGHKEKDCLHQNSSEK